MSGFNVGDGVMSGVMVLTTTVGALGDAIYFAFVSILVASYVWGESAMICENEVKLS